MNILEKAFIPLLLVIAMMASCNVFRPTPATGPTINSTVTEALSAIPTATYTDTPSPFLSPLPLTEISSQTLDKIIYYYFVEIAKDVPPERSVVIMPDVYILAPTPTGLERNPETVVNLRAALEAVLNDDRNDWVSADLEIVDVTFRNGHADVVLQGEYFGVGDVTLIAASMQILMTVFADASVQTASVTLNGDTIGNLGVSISLNAKPADYLFTRTEVEAFMNEHAYVSP